MRKALPLIMGCVCVLGAQMGTKLIYPPAPKSNQVDDYHGTKVADPYRGLENADSPSTQKWVEQENALTNSYLAKLPGREEIRKQMTELMNYERFSGMHKAGNHYFYSHNTGLQNQNVIYVEDSLQGAARVLLDPNQYRADGTAALNGESVSWDGKLLAYAVAQAGSDWSDWHVREIATGKDRDDVLKWTKSGEVAWSKDDSGFYYARYPEPASGQVLTAQALNQKVYLHRLGDAQANDKLIYERPGNPEWYLDPIVTEDGRYLLLVCGSTDPGKNVVFYRDLQATNAPVVELIPHFESIYDPLGTSGTTFYFRTTDHAPKGRVIAIDVARPERSHWKEIVGEQPDTLEGAAFVDGKLVLSYMKDAHSIAKVASLTGRFLYDMQLPGIGTAVLAPARQSDREVFFEYTSYLAPALTLRLDLETGKSEVVQRAKTAFDSGDYETTQVSYASKDGTRIPMFLSYRKGLKQDGNNPTLLYGYGGFNIPITPHFSSLWAEWMEIRGIVAVATLRGGSEYGEAWHRAGMKEKKQNVFDDFIAAGEWLISNKYTSTPKLAIFGASNGGLLIGAVLNQRPDLFGAAVPRVGVMDMLRFQKFGFGVQWVGEYGSADNPEDFKVIRAYSPLHNIRKGVSYPPTLILTSDHDDRVMPGHSLKYAATLQDAQEGPGPILIRIETRAGHGAGLPVTKQIEESTDMLSFLRNALGMNGKAPLPIAPSGN